MRPALAFTTAALLCCAAPDDGLLTLRVGKEWSPAQSLAIASACAEVDGCSVTPDGEIAVSRRSGSIKRMLVDAIPGRRRLIIDDSITEPDDIERAVLSALGGAR